MHSPLELFIYKNGVNPYKLFSALLMGFTALTVALVTAFSPELSAALGYVLGINLATFLLCVYDKAVAGSKFVRVPEAILYFAAFVGGSPALLFGMKILRHKTQKVSFQFVLVILIVAQFYLFSSTDIWKELQSLN